MSGKTSVSVSSAPGAHAADGRRGSGVSSLPAGGSFSGAFTAAVKRAWRGIVWYVREFSGEAKYDHYVEHLAAEHPDQTPMTPAEFMRARERYDREHPNTSCCC